ncbi:ligase-associated DNA damage response endonuclease PdeM [Acidiphilium acidophilum]|uniref:ligase-associated DNA damage response endonuclease PdeM n=1 Tax=Acidiphilium acidophilum TaxID=76588 RepID=UPI002E8E76EE|nr:ligase-associated DNA damage response endonuclease PdeM [Acidiphilium acidophilum]
MNAAPIHRAGHRFMLDPAGVVIWPARRTLIVADLHLEKASASAARGSLVPPYDTRTTLDRLALLLRHYAPETVIALGDSFHDAAGPARLAAEDAARLARLEAAHQFVWIAGNHDQAVGGMESWHEDHCVFRHEASEVAAGMVEFSGHFHPKARIATRAAAIGRPCFVTDQHRVLLPSFGAYTGGLDVTAAPIRALFPRGGQVFMLSRDRVFAFPLAHAARAA